MKSIKLYTLTALLLISCSKTDKPSFIHDISSSPTPWTSEIFEPEEEDFTFAIISDLTGGERPGIYNTAVTQLNRLDPTFVLSVGDLIEGGTEDSTQMAKEWDSFDSRTSNLNMPFFHLGGNHDLTNPLMKKFWNTRFGPTYYHFIYEDVLFLMLDSEDYEEQRMWEINEARAQAMKILSGEIEGVFEESAYMKMSEQKTGAMSTRQLEYFKSVLKKYPKVKWTFILMHKPLWTRDDEKGLGPLEEALSDRSYAVINGHVHSFSHRKRKGMDYTMLGTTGGYQAPGDSMAFDHITLIRMAKTPVITHLKMNGILDENGRIPE